MTNLTKKRDARLFISLNNGFNTTNTVNVDLITAESSTAKICQKSVKKTNKRKQICSNIVEKQIETISRNMQNYNPCTELLRLEKKQMYIDARKAARKKLK